ncbi:hypothetical protein G5A97_12965 [[Clostridium] symbiosum]|nr:hypothetical protein [[Clostridium] symbiosum]
MRTFVPSAASTLTKSPSISPSRHSETASVQIVLWVVLNLPAGVGTGVWL